ncbi:hypothetical protein [Kineococcus sp. SYSU DK002]|uniref:hypothetical protein n=1 Tax=Kineococcus sp. SYSU DK002 TaxID=3383123 RepID=UPI003D7E5F7E
MDDLQVDVAAGKVSQVQVTGGLPPGSTGMAWQEVQWHAGWWTYQAQVQLVTDPADSSTSGTGTSGAGASIPQVTGHDVGVLVQEWDPTVSVERRGDTGSSVTTTVWGVGVPGWVGLLGVLQWLGAVVLLVRGPEPRWVSRWGWFWLSALPLGVTAFLVMSGPLPGRRYVPPGLGRLRGGRAFVVALLLAAALGGIGGL